MSNPAPGELELVRSLVNTWDAEDDTDAWPSPDALGTWLAGHELLDDGARADVDADDLRHAVELREALRALLRHNHGDELDPAAPVALEAAARRAQLSVRFDAHAGIGIAPLAEGGVDRALGEVVARIADAMREGTWKRLKVCPAENCQWAFYDTSRNRSAVWCDMGVCGNRQKVKTFRQRQRAGG
jgi:predicted RNA-binding Zn ribbon-like protein